MTNVNRDHTIPRYEADLYNGYLDTVDGLLERGDAVSLNAAEIILGEAFRTLKTNSLTGKRWLQARARYEKLFVGNPPTTQKD